MKRGNSDLVEITVQVHHKTDKAILVSDSGERVTAVWLPLSQIEVEMKDHAIAEITLPEWLAMDKGLI